MKNCLLSMCPETFDVITEVTWAVHSTNGSSLRRAKSLLMNFISRVSIGVWEHLPFWMGQFSDCLLPIDPRTDAPMLTIQYALTTSDGTVESVEVANINTGNVHDLGIRLASALLRQQGHPSAPPVDFKPPTSPLSINILSFAGVHCLPPTLNYMTCTGKDYIRGPAWLLQRFWLYAGVDGTGHIDNKQFFMDPVHGEALAMGTLEEHPTDQLSFQSHFDQQLGFTRSASDSTAGLYAAVLVKSDGSTINIKEPLMDMYAIGSSPFLTTDFRAGHWSAVFNAGLPSPDDYLWYNGYYGIKKIPEGTYTHATDFPALFNTLGSESTLRGL